MSKSEMKRLNTLEGKEMNAPRFDEQAISAAATTWANTNPPLDIELAYIKGARYQHSQDQAKIAELEAEVERLKAELKLEKEQGCSPYCPTCGSCGEDGCCKVEMCRYPDMKTEEVRQMRELTESVLKENAALRELVREWLAATPTDENGDYDPINQPQAWKATRALGVK